MASSARASAVLPMALAASACGGVQSSLDAAGPAAARIETLWWVLFWVCAAVFAAVAALLAWALARPRGGANPSPLSDLSDGRDIRFVVIAGAAVPAVIIVALMLATVRIGADLAEPPPGDALRVDIVGHQFWWEIHYPDHGVVTANELHIPAGRPVRVRVSSADVIHSFWVPRLHGKLDLTPGRVSEFWLEADETGTYRGQCAEYCGRQHAKMAFLVIARPPTEFADWLEARARPAPVPPDAELRRGLRVFLEQGCDACHMIRGVTVPQPDGEPGPDLTHIASRRTLAAATLENTRGNLAGWILDPQAIKPGNRMPPTRLEPDALHALLAYLESLR